MKQININVTYLHILEYSDEEWEGIKKMLGTEEDQDVTDYLAEDWINSNHPDWSDRDYELQ